MRTAIVIFILCFLVSCSAGPVYVAKNEKEGLKTSYHDPKLSDLSRQYQGTLKDIYLRYQRAKIDVYPAGLGFTTLSDEQGKKFYYLLVQVRPQNISFDEVKTTPEERFGEVFQRQFEKNLRYLRKQDVEPENIDGLAFGVYWPVRDLSQCDKYGGFIEYAVVYLKKADFLDVLDGETTFSEAVKNAQVVTSLNQKNPDTVNVIEAN